MSRISTVVLAGGKGTRLEPLTTNDAKPAIPFAGVYKIIDFTLSNCINSGLRKIFVLTQFKSMSLERHIHQTWRPMVNWPLGEYVETVAPQQRVNEQWYQGNADAVYQNLFALEKDAPQHVVVLGGDHIYQMNYREMLDQHIANRAAVTVGGLPVPVEQAAGQFGVMEINSRNQIVDFKEKPAAPRCLPSNDKMCLASMGIYIFEADYLFDQLCKTAIDDNTSHDFGRDIIPKSIASEEAFAFEFRDPSGQAPGYWRDVGTLDSLFNANMDLLADNPGLQLGNPDWPIWRATSIHAPTRISSGAMPPQKRASLISAGCNVEGTVIGSVLAPGCVIEDSATVENCILSEDVRIERGAQVRNSMVTEGITIPPGCRVGFDAAQDIARGAQLTPQGRTIVAAKLCSDHRLGSS